LIAEKPTSMEHTGTQKQPTPTLTENINYRQLESGKIAQLGSIRIIKKHLLIFQIF